MSAPRMYIPLAGLATAWQAKLPMALSIAVVFQMLDYLGSTYAYLLRSDPVLVVLILTLMGVDLITGIIAALKRRDMVTSRAFRRTGLKFLEYSAIGGCSIMVANGFSNGTLAVITDSLDDAALMYIAITEAMSIIENVTGSRENARKHFRRMMALWRDRDLSSALEDKASSHDSIPPSSHE